VSYDPGDLWTAELTVKDADGVLTAATVTVSVTSPTGTVTTPTVDTATTGVYTADIPLTEAGTWLATWTVAGALTGVEKQTTYVRRWGGVVNVSEVRAALNKTLTVDDPEIERMIDAALAEYEQVVGPVSGSVTEKVSGGRTSIVLRNPSVSEITAAAYTDGTTITLADLDLDTSTGMLHWGSGTAGYYTSGTRNVEITSTAGGLPANHREAVIADVAGYFAATQRGGGAGPSFASEGYEAPISLNPLVLFPRIRALAVPGIA
jgi:hypothetical protein